MRIAFWTVFAVLLAGCAASSPALPPQFSDAVRFAPSSAAILATDPFALDPHMRQFLDTAIRPALRERTPQQALPYALANRTELKIEYDAALTRNAAQTFDAHAGNCLSLVILTAAFARELNLTVTYNLVSVDEIWSRRAGMQSTIGHVNLTLGRRLDDLRNFNDARNLTTIDFLPPKDLVHQRSREISEATVVAMYLNNRAVELLAEDKLDEAYWSARAAVLRDPGFASARNTLGVVYLHHGDLQAAAEVFDAILQQNPRDTTALVNQIAVLSARGQPDAAMALAQTLRRLQPVQPFQFLDAGIAAVARQDFAEARLLLQQELARDPDDPETLYWLGTVYARLGQTAQAGDYLREAIGNSTTGDQRLMYAAKLKRLKSGAMD